MKHPTDNGYISDYLIHWTGTKIGDDKNRTKTGDGHEIINFSVIDIKKL